MVKVITHPMTRKILVRTALSLGKLGLFATASILSNQTFKESANAFMQNALSDYRRIKFVMEEA